jgi:single-stranded-DNA-specific exonuclease
MKSWNILNKLNIDTSTEVRQVLLQILLENRGLKEKKEISEFLNPTLESINIDSVGIDKLQLEVSLKRIKKAIDKGEQMVVYGDYDVDGITGSGIVWETLDALGGKAIPYLPDRFEEGYGLSVKGISNLIERYESCNLDEAEKLSRDKHGKNCSGVKLIITVDNGIVANEAVEFANKNNIDVIVTDHHAIDKDLPKAHSIVHTTKMCGSGIAWFFSVELRKYIERNFVYNFENDRHIELACLGTIADMVSLTGANRAIVKYGLDRLAKSNRPGLKELFKAAGGDMKDAGVYEVGFVISPRLNAAGRIENAMDSLRLICTKDSVRAGKLADKLETVNKERQIAMKQAAEHASMTVKMEDSLKKILVVSHEGYREGVIGLAAGKLVEEFYRPSIVIARGEKYSKASARSVEGFNVIEFLRLKPEFFVNLGGHPMAAGFTIENEKVAGFKDYVEGEGERLLDKELLTRKLRVDCEIPFSVIDNDFYASLQQLAPFGMGNPEPVFATRGVTVADIRILGKEGKHLKLYLKSQNSNFEFEAIAFGFGEMGREIKAGDIIDVAYCVGENSWNGMSKLQLKVKGLRILNKIF